MKRSIIALALCAVALLGGCAPEGEKENPEVGGVHERFEVEYRQLMLWEDSYISVIRDTETGERFLYASAGYIVPMVEPEV